MVAWLLDQAGNFADVLVLIGTIATGGIWVVRMLLASKKRVEKLFEAVERIEQEFKPNGGGSMRDQINFLSTSIGRIDGRQWAFIDGLREPTWEADAGGSCVRVNRALQTLAQRPAAEFVGNAWENIVHKDDRERVWREWTDAVGRHRPFESGFRVRAANGDVFIVTASATPVRNGEAIVGWIGRYDFVIKTNENEARV